MTQTPTVITTSDEPQRRLSLWRLLLATLLLVGLIYGVMFSWQRWQDERTSSALIPWFAGYVDVTSKPTYPFEQIVVGANSQVVLSFIVSKTDDPCTPTWGNYFTLDEAAVNLDLDRRIARLQQQGGQVAISFGGFLNDELALKCVDEDQLLLAYQSVIDRYHINTIDLDLENEGLSDTEAGQRRARVLARLQAQKRSLGQPLAIWLTLPVAPQGLTPEGTTAVSTFLAGGADLAGLNVMTMNYGGSKESGQSMQVASEQALFHTHRQLGILYRQIGINLSPKTLWRKVGATPMIGQNDVPDEIFTLDDAKGLNYFASQRGVGRMSMWSVNRDTPCSENYVDTKVVSDSCSGVKTERLAFSQALSLLFEGSMTQNAETVTTDESEMIQTIVDDPATSPYQIWQETGAYPKGVKIVWKGHVYEAKWWTKGDVPDNPVLQIWETPWQLVGPVLPGERPIQQPTLPTGTYPEWSGTTEYQGGDRVLFEGIPFQAKWWNMGESPAATAANADASPWLPLPQSEILAILEKLSQQPVSTDSATITTEGL